MKYLLLFINAEAFNPSDPGAARVYEKVEAWFERYGRAGKIVSAEQLDVPEKAATVRFDGGSPVVSDGPFIEAKESIGGYALVEVADREEALEMAKGWPAGTVEVRPTFEMAH